MVDDTSLMVGDAHGHVSHMPNAVVRYCSKSVLDCVSATKKKKNTNREEEDFCKLRLAKAKQSSFACDMQCDMCTLKVAVLYLVYC